MSKTMNIFASVKEIRAKYIQGLTYTETLHTYQQYIRISIVLHLVINFFDKVIDVNCYLIFILNLFFPNANDLEQIFV